MVNTFETLLEWLYEQVVNEILIATRDPTSPTANQQQATSKQNHPPKDKVLIAQQGVFSIEAEISKHRR